MPPKPPVKRKKKAIGKDKMATTMHEFKAGDLHSGAKDGPKVKSRKQAIAIGMSQKAKADGKPTPGAHMKNVAASKAKNKKDANRRGRNKGRS